MLRIKNYTFLSSSVFYPLTCVLPLYPRFTLSSAFYLSSIFYSLIRVLLSHPRFTLSSAFYPVIHVLPSRPSVRRRLPLLAGNVIWFDQSETSINLQVWLWVCQYLKHLRGNFKTCGETIEWNSAKTKEFWIQVEENIFLLFWNLCKVRR